MKNIEIVGQGRKYWSNFEFDGGRQYWIIKSNERLYEEDVLLLLEKNNVDIEGYEASHPGKKFLKEITVNVYGRKAIAYQRFGWDV